MKHLCTIPRTQISLNLHSKHVDALEQVAIQNERGTFSN